MKVVQRDNFDRKSDILVEENVSDRMYGEMMVQKLNQMFGGNTSNFYFSLEEDSYILHDADTLD